MLRTCSNLQPQSVFIPNLLICQLSSQLDLLLTGCNALCAVLKVLSRFIVFGGGRGCAREQMLLIRPQAAPLGQPSEKLKNVVSDSSLPLCSIPRRSRWADVFCFFLSESAGDSSTEARSHLRRLVLGFTLAHNSAKYCGRIYNPTLKPVLHVPPE